MDPIRVFVADDHELTRYALRTMLEAEDGIEVVGEASDGVAAVRGCGQERPDVLVLAMRMPVQDGIDTCREAREACPDTAVLVLTSRDGDEELFGMLSAGACGYLLKDTRPERIVHAIRAVADGETVFDSPIADRLISGRLQGTAELEEPLSEREMEVLHLMAEGQSNKEIGRTLWISEATVKTHVSHVLRKLGQADRTQAVLAAVRTGLIELGR